MTYPSSRTADDCTVDGVTVDGHYYKNVYERGKPPNWRCVRCGHVKGGATDADENGLETPDL